METIGDRLKALRNRYELSGDELGQKLQVGKSTISLWENNKRKIDNDTVVKIAKIFNVTTDYLLSGKQPSSVSNDEDINLNIAEGVPIPILGEIAAGTPIPAVEDIDVYDSDSYALIGERMAASGTYYGLRIRGASMEPRMFEDDVVIVRQQSMVDSGQIAVVLINGDTATVKQVKFDDNGITLIGFNEEVYPPRHFSIQDVISMPVQIIGRVVEVRGKL